MSKTDDDWKAAFGKIPSCVEVAIWQDPRDAPTWWVARARLRGCIMTQGHSPEEAQAEATKMVDSMREIFGSHTQNGATATWFTYGEPSWHGKLDPL